LVLGLLVQFLKGIVYLQSFCVVLGGWVFIKSNVRRGAFFMFGVGGVLGQFYIGYGTLVKTLFSLEHRGLPIKKGN
jgi:hypothetical protein